MKHTSKTVYGLKFMLHLASTYNEGWLSLIDVAEKESISVKFLENIVAAIKSKGLLKVKRGAHGGYSLSKSPSAISLKEIFEALEVNVFVSDTESEPNTAADVVLYKIFNELDVVIRKQLESKTLADLLHDYELLKPGQMFYI